MPTTVRSFKIVEGYFDVTNEFYKEEHWGLRTNWAAKVKRDKKAPGGLAREFLEKGRTPRCYSVDGVRVGDCIEVSQDGDSSWPVRDYFRVEAVNRKTFRVRIVKKAEIPSVGTAAVDDKAMAKALVAGMKSSDYP
jgi:hypothetical protein